MAEQEFETAADELSALMDGSLKLEPVEPEVVEEEITEENEVTDNEDTDLQDEVDTEDGTDEAETNEMNDEDSLETDESTNEGDTDDEEENAQVEDDSLQADDDEEDDASDDDEGEDGTETEDKDDSQDDGADDDAGKDTDEIDYKVEYEKFKGFYDEVTSEFTANGKKMKGFTDPKKIIQSQQMAAGFSEKMSAFKPYRQFMSTIKEKGWLDDPAKFDMAVNLMDKDPEAIKQLVKDSELDILELDMDNINYRGQRHTTSNAEVVLDDVMSYARNSGVEADMQKVLGGEWSDDGSLVEVLNSPEEAQSLVNHMQKDADGNSAYADIMSRVEEKTRTDFNGSYSSKNSLQKYREAAGELSAEFNAKASQEKLDNIRSNSQANKVEEEKARIAAERKERDYKAKAQKETSKVNNARKKAANISKPKRKAKVKPKFDPIDKSQSLEGAELVDYFQKEILGKRY